MGNTYKRQPREEQSSERSGKHNGHSNNWKTHGIRVINLFDDSLDTQDNSVDLEYKYKSEEDLD